MTEQQRWDVQATFWRAVAGTCASADAVMFYELSSEPLVDDGIDPSQPGAWYGGEFGGLAFAQRISLQRNGRSPVAIARQWITKLAQAVRAADPTHLITVGLLPDPKGAFASRQIADLLDFLTVHEYPDTGQAGPAIATMKRFAAAGSPVLVGETSNPTTTPPPRANSSPAPAATSPATSPSSTAAPPTTSANPPASPTPCTKTPSTNSWHYASISPLNRPEVQTHCRAEQFPRQRLGRAINPDPARGSRQSRP